MGEAHQGAVARWLELDHDGRRPCGERGCLAVPAPGEDDPLVRDDLDKGSRGDVDAWHANADDAAGTWVELAAHTWGQIVVALKQYAETGRRDPVFT